jgi:hypothetical protein
VTGINDAIDNARCEVIGCARYVVNVDADGLGFAVRRLAIAFERLDGLRAIARDHAKKVDAVLEGAAHD